MLELSGKWMDPILYDILNDGTRKYLGGMDQTPYDILGPASRGDYGKLQQQQQCIGWDNLIRGKYSKLWRSIQRKYTTKQRVAMEEHSKSITSHNTVEPIPLRWNQSVNQPVQSVCQPVSLQNRPNQPVDQPTTQPVDQSMHQPTQQQEIQPENQPAPTHIMDQPTNQTEIQRMNQQENQPGN